MPKMLVDLRSDTVTHPTPEMREAMSRMPGLRQEQIRRLEAAPPLEREALHEIEQAIAKLPPGEFVELERWFDAERNRMWDRQIEGDAQSGKLRELDERLQAENQGQSTIPLDEFLTRSFSA